MILRQLPCIWRYLTAHDLWGVVNLVYLSMAVIVLFKCSASQTGLVLVGFQIGRRIFRQRLETGDRDADMEQRQVGLYACLNGLLNFQIILWC